MPILSYDCYALLFNQTLVNPINTANADLLLRVNDCIVILTKHQNNHQSTLVLSGLSATLALIINKASHHTLINQACFATTALSLLTASLCLYDNAQEKKLKTLSRKEYELINLVYGELQITNKIKLSKNTRLSLVLKSFERARKQLLSHNPESFSLPCRPTHATI